MHVLNFVRILILTLALSGYSVWVMKERVSQARPEATEDVAGIPLWSRADVDTLWHDAGTLFVDVRSAIDFEFGHVTGAVNLPDDEFAQRFPDLKERLERATTIIVY